MKSGSLSSILFFLSLTFKHHHKPHFLYMGVISIQMNLTTFSSLSLVLFLPPKQSSSCVEQVFFLDFGEFYSVKRSSKT